MRAIKFRAWDEDGVMFEPLLIEFRPNGEHVIWEDRRTLGTLGSGVITLMQYTGLKDKNGQEIYEGDIIEHWDEKYIVPEFTPLDRSYQAENIKEHHDGSDDWMSMSNVDWEVIGNIYENPELIK